MRKFLSYTVVLLSASILFNACQHDIITVNSNVSLEPVVVVKPPTTTTPTGGTPAPVSDTVCFNTDVLPLYVSYCGSSGCHNDASHRSGVITTDYGHLMNGIRAKNSNNSRYYTIIGNGMPSRSSPQMTATHIALIKKWIDQGALNTQCTNVCDTNSYTYANAIQTIISTNCGGCHGTKPGSANIYLGDYASAKTYITANASTFLNAINYVSTIAVSKRMPPSAKLVDCKIIQIQKWIQKGYPQ
jgi:uncharacterized membrane protein